MFQVKLGLFRGGHFMAVTNLGLGGYVSQIFN